MNVIDHAILIPASPEFIWRFLGDLNQNSKWQEDCTNLSYLTTQHEGRGTRWRYTTPKGKDVIVEISAWYETLGYEYSIIEGASVGENQGRIRLQEIAEGTLVQWTFNYEVEGMLSGLRNSIGLKRSLTNNIQDSLRNLYKLIQQETGGISTHEARASMKDAPDVEERVAYRPRHPSKFNDETESSDFEEPTYPSEDAISYQIEQDTFIEEPPVADDDTKPNPIIQGTEELDVVTTDYSQSLHIDEPPVADDDTQPNTAIDDHDISVDSTPIEQQQTETTISEPESDSQVEPQTKDSESDIRDTSRISVFEIFGLQKPSETQEISAISEADMSSEESPEPDDASEADALQTAKSESTESDTPISLDSEVLEPVESNNDVAGQDLAPSVADIPTVVEDIEAEETYDEAVAHRQTTNMTESAQKTNHGLRLIHRKKLLRLRTRN